MTSGTRRSDLTDLTTPEKLKSFFDSLKEIYDYINYRYSTNTAGK